MVNCFANHEYLSFPDAGHMLHYDVPGALGQAWNAFLAQHFPLPG